MVIVISPAKSLDFGFTTSNHAFTQPNFSADANTIAKVMQRYSVKKMMALMDISQDLAALNVERYARWQDAPERDVVKEALFAFRGDVYVGMQPENFSEEDVAFAQQHLRILSGLYGLLRPLDLIQAYRLEMGTSVKIGRKKNLYDYWGSRIAQALQQEVELQGASHLINLASEEYFDSVDTRAIKVPIIKPVFLDLKNGQYKVVSFWAKKARGMMSAYIIQNRLKNPEELKGFQQEGYAYNAALSKGNEWAFTREPKA